MHATVLDAGHGLRDAERRMQQEGRLTEAGAAALAAEALRHVAGGQVIGLGTGHAAAAFVHALGARVAAGLDVRGVPTSEATAALARGLGIKLVSPDDVEAVDVAIDGADEVDPRGDLIKGYGGALVREKVVAAHHETMRGVHLRELFAKDPQRGERLVAEAAGLYLDYSKQRVTDETLRLLLDLARACGVRARVDAMFAGEKINVTEGRAVLHVALRAPRGTRIGVDGEDVVPGVHAVLDRMAEFAGRVRGGAWTGFTGRPIRNIVNIGIGGSDLGPAMATDALRWCRDPRLTLRFVSNVDGADFVAATHGLDPAGTLFIVSSKTF